MLQLVRLSPEYRAQLNELMDEWSVEGDSIVPWAIRKNDYHDFGAYLAGLEIEKPRDGKVPDTVYSVWIPKGTALAAPSTSATT